MINKVHIKNFKSIKDLEFDCSRVNIFIGEPNTGKSNILEALGMFTSYYENNIKKFIRFRTIVDLYHKQLIDNDIRVTADDLGIRMINYENFQQLDIYRLIEGKKSPHNTEGILRIKYDYDSNEILGKEYFIEKTENEIFPIKLYHYKIDSINKSKNPYILLPPFGENLEAILRSDPDRLEFANSLFSNYGYKLDYIAALNAMALVSKAKEPFNILPLYSASDTFLRLIFYETAIETNNECTLIFEEPESHTFPYYTELIAEKIGKYSNNQFFLTTHNPYFLKTIMEKTIKTDLTIFITYYKNYQTYLYKLKNDEISEYMESGDSLFIQIKDLSNELVDGKKN